MNQEEQRNTCKICNYPLQENDFEDTCIDCAVFNQGALLGSYKRNMIAASKKKAEG